MVRSLLGAWLLLICLPAFLSLAAAEENLSDTIPGWIRQGDAWVPADPAALGPRATGLQIPFPAMKSLEANPMTPQKVALGRLLFFDPILSGENTISCAHCHHPDYGLADGRKLSMGFGGTGVGPDRVDGDELGRSAPSLWNAAFHKWQFWDGRADDLEAQAAGPITNEHEMGEDPERLVEELREIPEYVEKFQEVFGGDVEQAVTFENVTRAVAAFERTLLSFNSRFDRYAAGDFDALTAQERSGMKLFRSLKTRCFECHNFPTFADDTFRVIGVPDAGPHDAGRASVPGEGPDGAFKTPSLRNVALTAPYMHNGSLETLEDVIKFYAKGGGRAEKNPPPGIDDKIGKFDITDAEIADLVAFLHALTDISLQPVPPETVPSGLPVVECKTMPTPAPPLVAAARVPASRGAVGSSPPRATQTPATAPAATRRHVPLTGYSNGNLLRAAEPRPVASELRRPSKYSGVSATFTVRPGQSIQAAVDRCQPGDRVQIEPGTYHETIVVDKSGITLAGVIHQGQRPVLDGGGVLADAVQCSGSDFTVAGLAVRHYQGNGILASKASGVTFRDLIIDDTGLYGVYPVECTGVVVEHCTVSRISDAAIYVGSSRDVMVRNNEVFNSVAGIEIENCVGAVVSNNSAHHNSTGILVFVLPNNPAKVGSDCRVIHNRAWANNHQNFGKPGTIVANLPTGIGILVMAADRTEVTQNWIADNNSYGVAVVALTAARLPSDKGVDVEPNSDYTAIFDNTYEGNGREPHAAFSKLLKAPGGDLFWDGTGVGNTWRESPALRAFPAELLGAAEAPAATAASAAK